MRKKYTTEEFINKAREIHGDKYDYSKVNYVNVHTKVCILCSEHGEFWQEPTIHFSGHGCPKCGDRRSGPKSPKYTTLEFIKKAQKIHNDRYDYSQVEYVHCHQKVNIICKKHGVFKQAPTRHLMGQGCPKCANQTKTQHSKLSFEDFLLKARKTHGWKYDYSKSKFANTNDKIIIICPKHGEFVQRVSHHLTGTGCPKCSREINARNLKKDLNLFLEQVQQIHKNYYDYSKVEYNNQRSKICIICPKHGEFWQTAQTHLYGSGCPRCQKRTSQNKLYESLCKDLNINLEFDARTPWLGLQSLDIYSKEHNFAVEYDGLQHFQPVEYFGGKEHFEQTKNRDLRKNILCEENSCKLFRVKYDYTEEDYGNLLNEIKKIIKKDDS